MNVVLEQRPERLPMAHACAVLGLNRSTGYRRRKQAVEARSPRRSYQDSVQPRALSEQEREYVIKTLHDAPYCDQPPAAVYQRFLEKDQYLCSVSTRHRLLHQQGENGERCAQRPAQHHAIPRLLALAPNEVWSWDITPRPLVRRGLYRSLYVVLDLFSRYVVAWMLSR